MGNVKDSSEKKVIKTDSEKKVYPETKIPPLLTYQSRIRGPDGFSILVIGLTGSGKSSVVNALFNREIVPSGIGLESLTQKIDYIHGKKNDLSVTVIDTPECNHLDISYTNLMQPTINLVLLVISLEQRMGLEQKETLESLLRQLNYKENYKNFCIVFTHSKQVSLFENVFTTHKNNKGELTKNDSHSLKIVQMLNLNPEGTRIYVDLVPQHHWAYMTNALNILNISLTSLYGVVEQAISPFLEKVM